MRDGRASSSLFVRAVYNGKYKKVQKIDMTYDILYIGQRNHESANGKT